MKNIAQMDRSEIEKRAVGCMVGLAIGDSFGDAARMPDNRSKYQIIRELQFWEH